MDSENKLIWIDCEMSGLDPKNDVLLEISAIVTDADLQVVATGPNIVIHQPDTVLQGMNEWCKTAHARSGLVELVKESTTSVQDAQQQILNFVREHAVQGKALLCGNSVHTDRAFMKVHMPELEKFFHYRIVDVSTIKELVNRWYSGDPKLPYKKAEAHRAHEDIVESISELRFYRKNFFKNNMKN
ncbi:oligoribonuclease [bacterium]|jgi:oligoribonuclease|nr:oligoribonuclease [bacterium]MBT3903676.1 oligoribonuclease [bacterium]MBT4578082.1 oligoribonuclease [bacterium]MBT5346173.1 oligoribonuclease [bacterium]MBT6130969.1 oligoribonuclease [bacterium]